MTNPSSQPQRPRRTHTTALWRAKWLLHHGVLMGPNAGPEDGEKRRQARSDADPPGIR